MRIGITGSHGVGKSTLAEALASMLCLPLIEEQARVVARDLGIKNPSEIMDDMFKAREYQTLITAYQIAAEKISANRFVSDRTTIDNAAYWLKWHSHRWPSELNNKYYKTCMDNARNYDLIVYVPPEMPPADDGFRDTNRATQQEVDFFIQCLWAKSQPANWLTVTGSLEERIKQVLEQIKKFNLSSAITLSDEMYDRLMHEYSRVLIAEMRLQ